MNFCRGCGTDLRGGAEAGLADPGSDRRSGPTPAPATEETAAQPGSRDSAVSDLIRCPRCDGDAPAGHMFCPGCGAQLPTLSGSPAPEVVKRITAGREEFRPRAPTPQPELTSEPTNAGAHRAPLVRSGARSGSASRAWGRLVSVNRDGSDGATYYLSGQVMDVGADSVDVRLTGDPHVAPLHARFSPAGDSASVAPIDELNGVFWRVREPTEVLTGTRVLIGRELCRIDLIPESEREQRTVRQHGVELFASPWRAAWARLSHIVATGVVGDVRHFYADEVVVGREEGDILFSHDEFMSRRHASFRRSGERCILEDLGSSNGTFVRLDAPQVISAGDHLRIGDHMFRFETA